jgi:hypothetical protein
MRIISSFRDYYDHIAYQYGGGDPKVTYVRKPLYPSAEALEARRYGGTFSAPPRCSIRAVERLPQGTRQRMHPSWYRRDKWGDLDSQWALKWLACAGRYYLLVAPRSGDYRYPYVVLMPDAGKLYGYLTSSDRRWGALFDYAYFVSQGEERDAGLVEWSRLLGAPVFTFDDRDVDTNVPILAHIGMPALRSAEWMYQDLSYFVGNLLRESPDVKPPVEVSDKDKIVEHGFDLRQSFRHRKP